MELDMLVTLRKGLDTVLTMGFGIFWVPLFVAVVSPAAGTGVAVGLASSLAIAKRVISSANWRREHGWSLLVPGVGLWMTRCLAREDPTAAKVAARLSLIGAVGMLLLSTALNASSSAREGEKLRRAMQSEESTAAYLQGPAGRYPLEAFERSPIWPRLTPEQQQRFEWAWRAAERERWTEQIRTRAGSRSLESARSLLGYDRLTPSRQAEFDAAWNDLHRSRS